MRLLLVAIVSVGLAPFPEVTVRGHVDAIIEEGNEACPSCEACSDCRGTHLVLRIGAERVEVHLAPAWFLQRQGYTILPNDAVSVTGTRVKTREGRMIVARELRRGNTLMKLRDEDGLPLWRLLVRSTLSNADIPVWVAAVSFTAFELPHFIMERRMLLGIKERAERARTESAQRRTS